MTPPSIMPHTSCSVRVPSAFSLQRSTQAAKRGSWPARGACAVQQSGSWPAAVRGASNGYSNSASGHQMSTHAALSSLLPLAHCPLSLLRPSLRRLTNRVAAGPEVVVPLLDTGCQPLVQPKGGVDVCGWGTGGGVFACLHGIAGVAAQGQGTYDTSQGRPGPGCARQRSSAPHLWCAAA